MVKESFRGMDPSDPPKVQQANGAMTVADKVRGMIARQAAKQITGIKREQRLREDLQLRSLELVELALDLEDAFAISIGDGEIEALQTVGDVLVLVEERFA